MAYEKLSDLMNETLAEEPGDAGIAHTEPPQACQHALVMDQWSIRRGGECLEQSEALRDELSKRYPAPAIPADMYKLLNDEAKAKYRREVGAKWEHLKAASADFLAAAFEPDPQLVETCQDPTRREFLESLFDSEAYKELHRNTQLDELASEIAATHFAQGWARLAEEKGETDQPPSPSGGEGDAEQDFSSHLRCQRAAHQAAKAAGEETDDLQQAMRGVGSDDGDDNGKIPLDQAKAIFKRIRGNHTLRKIFNQAGRGRRLAQQLQRSKTFHGQDEMVDIECGNNIPRLLASELAMLADDDLEWIALRRYTERTMLQRQFRSTKQPVKGPVVFLCDESGSMDGEPFVMAKALALNMAWLAKHQKRWICLVGFSSGSTGNFLVMPPDHWDQMELIDWIEHFYAGGTSMDVSLEVLPKRWDSLGAPEGQTDIIQVTDALVEIPDLMGRNFVAWKATTQAKMYTIVLGPEDPGDFTAVSDQVWCIPNLNLEQDAIHEVLSI